MASNPAPDEIYVDPTISVPDGIRSIKRPSVPPGDNELAFGDSTILVEVGGTGSISYTEAVAEEVDLGIMSGALAAPSNFTVVSQTSRVVNGQVIIDVVIEVNDVQGAMSYEVRYTKA